MKEMLDGVKWAFVQKGYRKRRNSFYKIEDGFYKLIDFQKGACGGYFYINVGLHPIGLPVLRANALFIPDHPKEYECVLRERVGEIVGEAKREFWSRAQNWIGDNLVPHIIDVIEDIEAWFQKRGSFSTILDCSFEEISKMFPVAPILWEKEYLLLKFYCAFQVGHIEEAEIFFNKYSDTAVKDMNFDGIDSYLQSMLSSKNIER